LFAHYIFIISDFNFKINKFLLIYKIHRKDRKDRKYRKIQYRHQKSLENIMLSRLFVLDKPLFKS